MISRRTRTIKLIIIVYVGLFVSFHLWKVFDENLPSNVDESKSSTVKAASKTEKPSAIMAALEVPDGQGKKHSPESVQASKTQSSNSLSGERAVGLPETGHAVVPPVLSEQDIARILSNIEEKNSGQEVRNGDTFDDSDKGVVIVVQVHNRAEYLRHLIDSFEGADGINSTLIIFSHDEWNEEINDLVAGIDFAPTMQIFYPYSIQAHPREFPGQSPGDCPRDATKDQARSMKCLNAEWPDLYGHYREAKFTQTKHHWWWKANRVFDQLKVTKNFNGLVLFLEEDHYVAPDFLSVLKLVDKERRSRYTNCDIISLGTYLKNPKYNKEVEIRTWESNKHNMGFAFTRDLWRKFHACRQTFCGYDDYNWDWSLFHVSRSCFKTKLEVLLVSGPRVFHIGECGVHHKKSNCDPTATVKKVQDILGKAEAFMNPDAVKIVRPQPSKKKSKLKGNGGWGDKRDIDLCLSMAQEGG